MNKTIVLVFITEPICVNFLNYFPVYSISRPYQAENLIGKQVSAVVNFPKKQIGPMMSECLVTGFIQDDGSVILAVPDKPAKNGSRLA